MDEFRNVMSSRLIWRGNVFSVTVPTWQLALREIIRSASIHWLKSLLSTKLAAPGAFVSDELDKPVWRFCRRLHSQNVTSAHSTIRSGEKSVAQTADRRRHIRAEESFWIWRVVIFHSHIPRVLPDGLSGVIHQVFCSSFILRINESHVVSREVF